MKTLTDSVRRKIVAHLVGGEDYHVEVDSLINAVFSRYVGEYLSKVVDAKLRNEPITIGLLNPAALSEDVIIDSGWNEKFIEDTKALKAVAESYDRLQELFHDLFQQDDNLDIHLQIEFRKVGIKLTLNESLVVINTLAVKRAQLRGGLWSTAGKQVEKPLLITLCKLFNVPPEYYSGARGVTETYQREIDFYLFGPSREEYNCEVKLMGRGNPESADAIFARNPRVFVADKMSDLNKHQADGLGIHWIELRSPEGYFKFLAVLQNLGIPCQDFDEDLDERLSRILDEIFGS